MVLTVAEGFRLQQIFGPHILIVYQTHTSFLDCSRFAFSLHPMAGANGTESGVGSQVVVFKGN